MDSHAGLEDACFDSADWDSSDTSDLVDVLKRKSEGFFSGSLWGFDLIEGFEKGGAFVPGGVGGSFQHVVSSPA